MITPDGTAIQSMYRHDYVEYEDTVSGETYVVDGGIDYFRHSMNKIKPTFVFLTEKDPIEEIREHFLWGTYGINGDQRLFFVLLKDMSEDHIRNVLRDCGMPERMENMFLAELTYRRENGIT
jgi:hypothetical protein